MNLKIHWRDRALIELCLYLFTHYSTICFHLASCDFCWCWPGCSYRYFQLWGEKPEDTFKGNVTPVEHNISNGTIFYPLPSMCAGTSVGDYDDDDGQNHVCPDDTGEHPRPYPVARHRAVWWGSDQTGRGGEWDWKYQPKDWLSFILNICLKCGSLYL